MRGPTANAMSVPRGGIAVPAASQSARSPGRSAMRGSPSRTMTRFSPRSGIMSAIVPSAASPSDASALPAGTAPTDSSAWTSLKATPAPASPSNGIGRAGKLRVDQRVRRRQLRRRSTGSEREVVVGDHEPHPCRAVERHVDAAGAAVDGDDAADALRREVRQARRRAARIPRSCGSGCTGPPSRPAARRQRVSIAQAVTPSAS